MKIALVTGISRGIGKEVTEQLLEKGWKVYGLSRTQPGLSHANFVWLACDLSKPEAIAAAVESVDEPIVDLLVSNAGVAFYERASEVTAASYEQVFRVNVLSPMLLVAALESKLARATVVSVSSVSDRLAEEGYGLYGASKGAITRYFEVLALENPGMTVYSLLPSYVDTPMLRETEAENDFDWSRPMKAAEVAKLAVELGVGERELPSGANVIVVNNALKSNLESVEKLYGFNIDTGELLDMRG